MQIYSVLNWGTLWIYNFCVSVCNIHCIKMLFRTSCDSIVILRCALFFVLTSTEIHLGSFCYSYVILFLVKQLYPVCLI